MTDVPATPTAPTPEEIAAFVTAPLPGADPEQSISRMFEKLQADFVPPVAPVTTMFDESFVDALRKERDAAVASAKMLEKKCLEHEAALLHPQPVFTRQPECWAVKTLNHKVGLPEADAAYAQCLDEGWQTENVSVVVIEGVAYRIITLKRLVPTTPVGTRPSTSAHATLTADYVRQQQSSANPYFTQQRERMITEVIPVGGTLIAEEDDEPIPSFGELFKRYGVAEGVSMARTHAASRALRTLKGGA